MINISKALGIATLGTASLIHSASAQNDKKEIENPLQKPQPALKTPDSLKTNLKIVHKNTDESTEYSELKKVLDGLTDEHTYTYNLNYPKLKEILYRLSTEEKSRILKILFNETTDSINNKKTDLSQKENRTISLFWSLLKEYPNQMEILSKAKDEYQKLVGAYINAMNDPKRQIGVDYNHKNILLYYLVPGSYVLRNQYQKNIFPPNSFNEKWHLPIGKIIDRLSKEENKDAIQTDVEVKIAETLINALSNLAVMEMASNNKLEVFHQLLDLVDRNPKLGWKHVLPALIETVHDEAFINDNPKDTRIKTNIVIPNIKLISAIEEKINNKIINEHLRDGDVLSVIGTLSRQPFQRPGCLITWHKTILEDISKAEVAKMPQMLTDFQAELNSIFNNRSDHDCEMGDSGSDNDYNLTMTKEFDPAIKKYTKEIIKKSCESLLSPNSSENEKGRKVFDALQQTQLSWNYGWNTLDFTEDTDIKNLFLQVLQSIRERKVINNDAHMQTALNFTKLSKDKGIIREVFNSFNSVIDSLNKEKQENIPAGKQAILSYSLKLMEDIRTIELNKDNLDLWLECTDSLYTKVNEKIIADSTSPEILNKGWTLLTKSFNPSIDNFKEENKKLTDFTNKTLINFFDSLVKNSKGLDKDDREAFREAVYTGIGQAFCPRSDNPRNELMLNKALDCITKNCVEPKSKEGLEEIRNLTTLTKTKNLQYFNFNRAVVLGILDKNKDYIETRVKEMCQEALEKFASKSQDERLRATDKIMEFYTWINDIQKFYSTVSPGVLSNFISTQQSQNIEQCINKTNLLIEDVSLKHLSNVRVGVRILESSKNNVIDREEAKVSLNDLGIISKNPSQSFNSKYIEIVNERLKTEINPYTRGALYQALAKIPPQARDKESRSVIDYLRDGIAKESVITSRHIGEALGEIYLGKLFDKYPSNYAVDSPSVISWIENTHKDISDINNKLFEARFNRSLKELQSALNLLGSLNSSATSNQGFPPLVTGINDYFQYRPTSKIRLNNIQEKEVLNILMLIGSGSTSTASEQGSLPLIAGINDYFEYMDNKDRLLISVIRAAIGRGDGVMDFLTRSLEYSNIRNNNGEIIAEDKNGKTINIQKDVDLIIRNAKTALLGFSKAVQNNINSTEFKKITSSNGYTQKIDTALDALLRQKINTFESTLQYNTFDSLPTHITALIELHKLNERVNFEEKIDELKEKLFSGKTSPSLFEEYERTLLVNRSFTYSREPDFHKTTLGSTWDYINGLKYKDGAVISNEGLSSKVKYERYKQSRESLYSELEKLDRKLFYEEVTKPLRKIRENFLEAFFADVPNREIEAYLDIANRFGLSRELGNLELNLILERFENRYKMWAGR